MDSPKDTWQIAQNYLWFTAGAGAIALYYYGPSLRRAVRPVQESIAPNKRRSDQGTRAKTSKRSDQIGQGDAKASASGSGSEGSKKRKATKKEQPKAQAAPALLIQPDADDDEEVDMSTKRFAEQMARAQKGTNLSAPKSKQDNVRTVKQANAANAPVMSSGSSQTGADADDDMSPAHSPALKAGDVSDMLEPARAGPSTLRLTAPSGPQKQKAARQPKEEVVETKKQRQNRMKVEQRRLEREAEEKERKALEEKQRRAAREARGEPAKNGIPVSHPPANNAWTAPKAAQLVTNTPTVNGGHSAPLLDTFDVESTASSNGGAEPSTAATSTTDPDGTVHDHEGLSEEDQMAKALKESEIDSGWTMAVPKKQKKKTAGNDMAGSSTPGDAPPAVNARPVSKPTTNGKVNGFQALNDQYEQRTDVDPADASSWDA